jgi:TIR domain-containing protein
MDTGQAAPDIFVSYAHRDRATAEKLVKGLKEEGWSVWWDDELVGGTRFDRAIGDALTGAKCVIVIWSSASIDSDFVFDEAMSAYRRNVIVPLVIENAKPPLGFGRIQYIELDRPEGPDRLKDAVRRILKQPVKPRPRPARTRYLLTAALAVLLLGGAGLWWFGTSYERRFRALRSEAAPAAEPREVMVGVTVWRLRPSVVQDPPHTRMLTEPAVDADSNARPAEWTPVRIRNGADLPPGSKVRLGIESSRAGFAYVIDREVGVDGTTGLPQVVYPTERSRGDDDRVVPGELLQLPSATARIPYWDLKRNRSDYAGELLTIIVSPKPIEDLEKSGAAIPTERLLQWEKDWGSGVARVFTGPDGDLLTVAEARARTSPSHVLTPQDATPAAIYKSSRLNHPILVNYRLRMSP